MNTVCLTGRLTKNWDVRVSQSGTTVGRNSIAVQRRQKDDNGQYQSDFINLLAFGKSAEILAQYTQKGGRIGIQGRIQTGSYENQQGQKVYTTDVIIDNFDFLDTKQDKPQQSHVQNGNYTDFEMTDDMLPF